MKKFKFKKIKIKRLLKKIGKVLYGVIFASLLLVAGFIAISGLKIPGNYQLLTVLSGSMEPEINRGAVVVIKPSDEYRVGDVITVAEPVNPKASLTHRVVEVKEREGKMFYVTKGDANNAADTEERPKGNVLGKVLFSVPLVGYPISFAKTREGLIFLIIIPATIIVYSELMSIKKEAIKLLRERKKRKLTTAEKIEVEIGEEEILVERGMKKWWKQILKLLPLLIVVGITQMGYTRANFVDQEQVVGNVMSAATWSPTPTATPISIPTIAPSPSPAPSLETTGLELDEVLPSLSPSPTSSPSAESEEINED